MGEDSFQIVFRGRLVPGASESEVKANLARLFKIDPARVELLFDGARKVLKQGLDRSAADRYRAALRQAGIMVSVVNTATRRAAAEQNRPPAPKSEAGGARAVFPVDDPRADGEAPAPAPEPGRRAVFAVDDPAADDAEPAPPAAADEPVVGRPEPPAETGLDEVAAATLAPPGTLLTEPQVVTAPDISIEGLDLAAVGAVVDESERPAPPKIDLGEFSVSEDFERLDDKPPPLRPEFDLPEFDLADIEAVVDESERPPPLEIDLDGLSASDDYDVLDQRPPASSPEIDTNYLKLEED